MFDTQRAPGLTALVLAAALVLISGWSPALAGGSAFDKPAPYVLITKDGYRVDAMGKPAREGGKIRVRLAPRGQLTVLPEDSIDWEATERFNAPRPKASTRRPPAAAGGALSISGTSPGEPIEMTIIGSKSSVSSVPAVSTSPAIPADPAAVAAQLVELRRQLAAATSTYDKAVQTRATLEARQAELQQKVSLEPQSSGLQDYVTPSRKALEQVREQLAGANEQIGLLERRMNDIRFRAVDLGGSVD